MYHYFFGVVCSIAFDRGELTGGHDDELCLDRCFCRFLSVWSKQCPPCRRGCLVVNAEFYEIITHEPYS